MPASALIWNSYLSAPATGVQAKEGTNSTTAPAAGAVCVGRVTAPRAGPAVMKAMTAKAAASRRRSAAIRSCETSSAAELGVQPVYLASTIGVSRELVIPRMRVVWPHGRAAPLLHARADLPARPAGSGRPQARARAGPASPRARRRVRRLSLLCRRLAARGDG